MYRSCTGFAFLAGILLVFLKYPFFGVLIETFGFLNLFGCVTARPFPFALLRVKAKGGLSTAFSADLDRSSASPSRSDFFPVVLSFMRQLPVIGHFLSAPGVRQVRSPLLTDHACGNVCRSPRPAFLCIVKGNADTLNCWRTGDGPDMWGAETVAGMRELCRDRGPR